MHTIKLQIQDDIYDSIANKGIDINNKVQELLYNLADDGYPTITTQEATSRVKSAVNRYQDGTGTYTDSSEYIDKKTSYINTLKLKYANN